MPDQLADDTLPLKLEDRVDPTTGKTHTYITTTRTAVHDFDNLPRSAESYRQAMLSEHGINHMTERQRDANARAYAQNHSLGTREMRRYRSSVERQLTKSYMGMGMARPAARVRAKATLAYRAVLHAQDRIVGGNPRYFAGFEDRVRNATVNSAMGSHWADDLARDDLSESIEATLTGVDDQYRNDVALNVGFRVSGFHL